MDKKFVEKLFDELFSELEEFKKIALTDMPKEKEENGDYEFILTNYIGVGEQSILLVQELWNIVKKYYDKKSKIEYAKIMREKLKNIPATGINSNKPNESEEK